MTRRHRRPARKSRPAPPSRDCRLKIEELGHRGDGIAREEDGNRIYVPFTLAGEIVDARVRGDRGDLTEIISPADNRVAPPCPHFGQCGGCAVQHLAQIDYRAWKTDIVAMALARRGLKAGVDSLVDAHGDGRRRMTAHAVRNGGGIRIGFARARSHDVLAIGICPVLAPALAEAWPRLQRLAEVSLQMAGRLDIQATATETGLDVDVRGVGDPDYVALGEIAGDLDLARLTADGEIVAERRKPVLTMGAARVTPPPGGFLQATEQGERILAGLVTEHAAGAGKIADLFAGVGPFALRLAGNAAVHAVDDDADALAALDHAVRHTQGLKPITTARRDLFADPLPASELNGYDAVVFDPPRAGAEAQARELAVSKVPTAIAVSCAPATFARDAAILVDGGYTLERVTPVDQFVYTAHVEVVGVFRR